MSAGRSVILLAALAVILASRTVIAQSLSQSITNQSSATITYMGYNETGFMNTSEVSAFSVDSLETTHGHELAGGIH
jgi:hypothetical protein